MESVLQESLLPSPHCLAKEDLSGRLFLSLSLCRKAFSLRNLGKTPNPL
jgi:hypothetical protein